MLVMHNNTLVKIEQQKQPVIAKDITAKSNNMLGFDCRLSSLICIEFAQATAVFSHAFV